MKKQWIISVLLCVLAVLGQAQNFEDEFNAFAQQNEQVFNRFVDSINKQFAEAMEGHMRSFTGEQPKVRDPKPKPVNMPEAPNQTPTPTPLPKINPLQPSRPAKPEPERPSLPDIVLPESVKPAQPEPSVDQINILDFNLFGEDMRILKQPFPYKLSGIAPKNVSEFWIQLSECDYEGMLKACYDAREHSAFNDWATYQIVLELARQTYPQQYNEQAVMTIFLLNQIGLEAKVGFDDKHLFCLVAVSQQLYEVSYADIGSYRYYLFETDFSYSKREGRPFRTYDMPFPKQTHVFDMNIRHPLKSAPSGVPDSIIRYNMNMIELYKTYPQVDIEVYANAVPSDEFCASVNRVIKPYTDKLTPYKAVDLLLTYVQYSFDYATDDEQFGYEKPFFCEESYYYPKNDCEDRSVLFSFLVRYLLKLDVVLIDYPGHIATAVHFPTEVAGASVMYKGKRYVICDPTYIGASIGKEMSDFKPEDRTVIPLK